MPQERRMPMEKPFLTDVKELRRRARAHMEEDAVTEGYRANRATEGHAEDLRMLIDALSRDERRNLRESGKS
jgi:hypothetical protein